MELKVEAINCLSHELIVAIGMCTNTQTETQYSNNKNWGHTYTIARARNTLLRDGGRNFFCSQLI